MGVVGTHERRLPTAESKLELAIEAWGGLLARYCLRKCGIDTRSVSLTYVFVFIFFIFLTFSVVSRGSPALWDLSWLFFGRF